VDKLQGNYQHVVVRRKRRGQVGAKRGPGERFVPDNEQLCSSSRFGLDLGSSSLNRGHRMRRV
jgi:hypothetical protein